ncbi:TcaA NTF2-like domain-containing protein [Bacillus cereus]
MEFCKECGTKRKKESDRVCTNCGIPFPASTLNEENKVHHEPLDIPIEPKEEKSHKRTERTERAEKKKTGSSFKWISGISAGLIIVGGIGFGYFYVQKNYGIDSFVVKADTAIKNQDTSALKNMIIKDENNTPLSQKETQKLIEDIHDSDSIKEKVLRSLDAQSKGKKQDEVVLKVVKSSEKKWLVVPQYKLSVVPVQFDFTVPADSVVTIDDKKIKTNKDGKVSVKDMIPGLHSVKATKDAEEVELNVEAWNSKEVDTSELENAFEKLDGTQVVSADKNTNGNSNSGNNNNNVNSSSDNSNSSNNSSNGNNNTTKSQNGTSTQTTPSNGSSNELSLERAEEFIYAYLAAGIATFNKRDMKYVKPFIEPNSAELKNISDYLVTLEKKGIQEELLGADVLNVSKVSENVYNINVFSKYNISFNNGETKRFQSYNVVYQVVYKNNSVLLRKNVKEDLVEKRDL